MKYLPHTPEDVAAMLHAAGLRKLDDLYTDVPESLKLHHALALPEEMSEQEVRAEFSRLAEANRVLTCFAGAGAYDVYTPAAVTDLARRSEFSTSYTPYQGEVSQGTLRYIFEYQTMMARLTGLDVSNASMYDGTTAAAEAMMMAVAAQRKRTRVVASAALLPQVRTVLRTYAKFHGVDLHFVPARNGRTDMEALGGELTRSDVAAVLVPLISHYGFVEDLTGLSGRCRANKTLLITWAPARPLAVLRSPGAWGADIACGEAQSLGIPLSYGGPYLGYLCTTQALMRKMPGRIVGQTQDAEGRRAYVLTLQAREQHIRREKATSNICTAQGVMCLHAAIYLSLMGKKGVRESENRSYQTAHYLCDALTADQCSPFRLVSSAPFLGEFAVHYAGNVESLRKRCAHEGFLAGVPSDTDPDVLILAATEKRTREETDKLIALLLQ